LYFVHCSGEQFGPYSLRELQQYVAEKRVAATDFAWSDGMPQWVFVCDVIGNLRQLTPYIARSTTAGPSACVLEMPTQAVQGEDLLPGRFHFGRGLFFLSMVGVSLVSGFFSAFKDTAPLGAFIFAAGLVAIAILRVRDVGMNGWAVLLAFVPIANLFLYFRLFCTPRGYEITKKPDVPMKAICWSVGGLIALSLLIALLSSANH
jgi:uncharacterized membrane protein YhaH (DUF805 family)